MNDPAARLVFEADRAAGAQDFHRAVALLREAEQHAPEDVAIHLRLAGLLRAMGKLGAALAAVHRALALAPLDFTALMLRASLLDRADDPAAGEAWGHALAQRPDGPLPPAVAQALAEGERRHAAWLDMRERRMRAAMAAAEAHADPDERARIARFRSNVLRRTRPYHSEPTHYFFPGLCEREFHPRSRFPWLAELEAATDAIEDELRVLLDEARAEVAPYIQYDDHQPLRQWKPLNRNRDWSALHLWKNGVPVAANAMHCPRTMALLARLPQPQVPGASPNAMFSLLAPHTEIPPHVGVSNARLVCHLPLIVPAGCWFRVGAERRLWRRGEAFVFDDTIEHQAMNPSDRLRVVLIFDLWHPDLSRAERDAIAAMFAADGGVDLSGT